MWIARRATGPATTVRQPPDAVNRLCAATRAPSPVLSRNETSVRSTAQGLTHESRPGLRRRAGIVRAACGCSQRLPSSRAIARAATVATWLACSAHRSVPRAGGGRGIGMAPGAPQTVQLDRRSSSDTGAGSGALTPSVSSTGRRRSMPRPGKFSPGSERAGVGRSGLDRLLAQPEWVGGAAHRDGHVLAVPAAPAPRARRADAEQALRVHCPRAHADPALAGAEATDAGRRSHHAKSANGHSRTVQDVRFVVSRLIAPFHLVPVVRPEGALGNNSNPGSSPGLLS
jgi:hypothetical protein